MKRVPVFVCAAFLVSAPTSSFTYVDPTSVVDEFSRQVASLDSRVSNHQLEELARDLARLPKALDGFFEVGVTGTVVGSEGQRAPITYEQVELLSLTATHFDRRLVLIYVRDHLTEGTGDGWRRTALRLMAIHASPEDSSLLARLVIRNYQEQTVREGLLEPFKTVVVSIGERHDWAPRDLNWLANEAEPLQGVLIRAVGCLGDPEDLHWLLAHLDDPEHAAAALQEIGRLAPRATPALAEKAARGVRPFLRSEEPGQRKQALRALGALGDPASIPFVIRVLEEAPSSGERKMAHSALRQVSGVDLPGQPDAWERWHAEEQRWSKEELPSLLARLGSHDDAQVVAAVKALSEHTLHRRRISAELQPLLSSHESPTVRGQVCLALARLGTKQSAPDLEAALEDDDPAVRQHARTALAALTR